MTCICLCIGGFARPTSVHVRDARFVVPVAPWLLEIRYVSSMPKCLLEQEHPCNQIVRPVAGLFDTQPQHHALQSTRLQCCIRPARGKPGPSPVDKKMFIAVASAHVFPQELCNESTIMPTQTLNVSTTPSLKPMKHESTHPQDAET